METKKIQQAFDLSQDGKQLSSTDLGAGMFKDTRNKWHRSSSEEDRNPYQAELLEQDAGIQRQNKGVPSPIA